MSAERSTVMFATRLEKRDGGTYLSGFKHDERVARICFCGPVERVVVRDLREGETSEYWAWWDAGRGEFRFVFLSRGQVEMCFTYGTRCEVEKGNGEVVNVKVESSR